MHAPKPHPAKVQPRHAVWARLWLACLRALFSIEAMLSPCQQRRAAILWLPLRVLTRFIAQLLFLASATAPVWRMHRFYNVAPLKRASPARILMRAILRELRLRRADGDQFTAIARVLAAPHVAIAIVRALLGRCFNRRRAVAGQLAPVAALGGALHAPLAWADTS